MSILGNKRGATTVELLLVFSLVALFGMTMVTLILSGGDVYQRILDRKQAEGDARIAISYVNVLIRQSDMTDGVSVQPVDCSDRDALALKVVGDGVNFTRWVFYREGALWECIADEGAPPDPALSEKIIDIGDYHVAYDQERDIINQSVGYQYDGAARTLSMSVMLRSE